MLAVFSRILSARAYPDHTVAINWSDGTDGRVSFGDVLAKGGVFRDLQDPEYFVSQMRIGDNGHLLVWPGEIDFSADSLWYKAHGEGAEAAARAKSPKRASARRGLGTSKRTA